MYTWLCGQSRELCPEYLIGLVWDKDALEGRHSVNRKREKLEKGTVFGRWTQDTRKDNYNLF